MKMLDRVEENQMQIVKDYVNRLFKTVQMRNPNEGEFQQAVKEVLDSLVPVLVKNPNIYQTGSSRKNDRTRAIDYLSSSMGG